MRLNLILCLLYVSFFMLDSTQAVTYYSILGVRENASTEEVTTAYRRLIRRYHPDVNPNPTKDDLEKFAEARKAYENLNPRLIKLQSEIARRNQYQRGSTASVTPTQSTGSDYHRREQEQNNKSESQKRTEAAMKKKIDKMASEWVKNGFSKTFAESISQFDYFMNLMNTDLPPGQDRINAALDSMNTSILSIFTNVYEGSRTAADEKIFESLALVLGRYSDLFIKIRGLTSKTLSEALAISRHFKLLEQLVQFSEVDSKLEKLLAEELASAFSQHVARSETRQPMLWNTIFHFVLQTKYSAAVFDKLILYLLTPMPESFLPRRYASMSEFRNAEIMQMNLALWNLYKIISEGRFSGIKLSVTRSQLLDIQSLFAKAHGGNISLTSPYSNLEVIINAIELEANNFPMQQEETVLMSLPASCQSLFL